MLTRPELAAKLKITLRTVDNWTEAGHLPYLKISHLVLFYWPDVVEHLKAHYRVCHLQTDKPCAATVPAKGERK